MKKKLGLAAVIISMFFSSAVTVNAAIPQAYWQFHDSFDAAVASGDEDEIIRLSEEIKKVFYSEAASEEKAGILYKIYDAVYPIYQKRGDYDAAISALKAQLPYAKQLNFADSVKLIDARIRQIDPMTEVYALSGNTSGAPYYGAKNEPRNGAYYGRVYYGDAPYDSESAVSFYVECLSERAEAFDYLIRPYDNGQRMIQICYNMPQEGATIAAVNSGANDAKIISDMQYIGSLSSPALIRIGGEMNVWSNMAEPEAYKQAFIKITQIARQYAPNAAMVFSPNDISSWDVDIDSYYPGDEYVDWVGCSLYTNKFRNHDSAATGQDFEEMFYGNGIYANPITKLKAIVDKYGGKKPIIITEGGFGHTAATVDLTDFAVSRMKIMYTYANMVFPQVKGVIYFDNSTVGERYAYSLNSNPAVKAAYMAGTASNPALIKGGITPANEGYVKAGSYSDSREDIKLYSYCLPVGGEKVAVEYSLDGAKLASGAEMPYECSLKNSELADGEHELKVKFAGEKGGYRKELTYSLTKAAGTVTIKNK